MALVINDYKKVTFSGTGFPKKTRFLLEEDYQLGVSSNFSKLGGSDPGKIVSAVSLTAGNLGSGFTTSFKQFGLQIWTGSEPLTANLVLKAYMDKDAYKDVWVPVQRLIDSTLPWEDDRGGLHGPGPSLLNIFNTKQLDKLDSITGDQFNIRSSKNSVTVSIGRLKLYNVIIKKANPTFSKEVDTRGYPIFAQVDVEISTVFTATRSTIGGMKPTKT